MGNRARIEIGGEEIRLASLGLGELLMKPLLLEGRHKRCTKCGETKPLSDFSKNGKAKFGVASQCKFCRREYDKKRYQKNKVEISLRKVARLKARQKKMNYCKIKEAIVSKRYCRYVCNECVKEICEIPKTSKQTFSDSFG